MSQQLPNSPYEASSLLLQLASDIKPYRTLSRKPIQVQGHRGGYQPENTMLCFKQALDKGLQGIELDVLRLIDSNIYRFGSHGTLCQWCSTGGTMGNSTTTYIHCQRPHTSSSKHTRSSSHLIWEVESEFRP